MSDFWEKFSDYASAESDMDSYLRGEKRVAGLHWLTDRGRKKSSLPLPVEAGTRVAFRYNTGSVLTYEDIPGVGVEGVVVKVKCADGKVTATEDGRVFVSWEDGKFRPILAEHLRFSKSGKRTANNVAIRVASLGDLSGFFVQANSDDELVHKATKDLWSFRSDTEGGFVIERLFDFDGTPLKV